MTKIDFMDLEPMSLEFFSQNCSFLFTIRKHSPDDEALFDDSMDEIKNRLFQALGLDTHNKHSMMTWDLFVELYCIMILGKLKSESMI